GAAGGRELRRFDEVRKRRIELVLQGAGLAAGAQPRDVVRYQRQRRGQVFFGAVRLTDDEERFRAARLPIRVVGGEPDRLGEVRERGRGAGAPRYFGPGDVQFGVDRVEPQRFGQVGNGAVGVPELNVRRGAPNQRQPQERIQLVSAGEVRERGTGITG